MEGVAPPDPHLINPPPVTPPERPEGARRQHPEQQYHLVRVVWCSVSIAHLDSTVRYTRAGAVAVYGGVP